ncbi:MAG: hypothetical protein GY851_33255 [bacterium]|nr:hypothetical protein [bacterium]
MNWAATCMAGVAAIAAFGATGDELPECRFFSQWTLASHTTGPNAWPCVARLDGGQILVVWSRKTDKGYALLAAQSHDAGCSWKRPKVLPSSEGPAEAHPAIEVIDGDVYVTSSTGWCARSRDDGATWTVAEPVSKKDDTERMSVPDDLEGLAARSEFVHGGHNGVLEVWRAARTGHPLCAAASSDGGSTWSEARDIVQPDPDGRATCPGCTQAADGTLLAVWQQDVEEGRAIRLARFSVEWLVDGPSEAATPEDGNVANITLVAFGDSTTATRGPLGIYAKLLDKELPSRGVRAKVVNAGIGGNTTDMARARFEKDVLVHDPDVVTLGFGINDSAIDVWKRATKSRVSLERYEENLRHFIDTLKKRGARPVLMTPNCLAWTPGLKAMYGKPPYNPDDPDGFNVTLKVYAAAVRRIAEEKEVPLVDAYALFEGYAQAGLIDGLLLDGMHPNDRGHRLVADALLEVVPGLAKGESN